VTQPKSSDRLGEDGRDANVFGLFARKVDAALKAYQEIFGGSDGPLFRRATGKDASYTLASADALSHLTDESVDYVLTDPPFGSNIFYSDMSLFHEAWIGRTTDNDRGAVVYTTSKRKNGAAEKTCCAAHSPRHFSFSSRVGTRPSCSAKAAGPSGALSSALFARPASRRRPHMWRYSTKDSAR
jgi:adenine-specific DNA methylase